MRSERVVVFTEQHATFGNRKHFYFGKGRTLARDKQGRAIARKLEPHEVIAKLKARKTVSP